LIEKYIAPILIIDWVRKVNKNLPSALNQWKILVHVFPLIGKRLAWKVNYGMQIRIGSDVILGCSDDVIPPGEVTNFYEFGMLCST
jgi:hypothetical protein